jgi:hypothetical protein
MELRAGRRDFGHSDCCSGQEATPTFQPSWNRCSRAACPLLSRLAGSCLMPDHPWHGQRWYRGGGVLPRRSCGTGQMPGQLQRSCFTSLTSCLRQAWLHSCQLACQQSAPAPASPARPCWIARATDAPFTGRCMPWCADIHGCALRLAAPAAQLPLPSSHAEHEDSLCRGAAIREASGACPTHPCGTAARRAQPCGYWRRCWPPATVPPCGAMWRRRPSSGAAAGCWRCLIPSTSTHQL